MTNSDGVNVESFFALRLNNKSVTFLEKMEGGVISASVERAHGGRQYYLKKHIGKPIVEEVSIQVGGTMSQALFEWVAASWTGRAPKRDGAILACDNYLNIVSEHTFSEAIIHTTVFPALDASSKEPAYLSIHFLPENLQTKKGAGKLTLEDLGKQVLWRTSNFRLQIDGLETAYIRRIDPFVIDTAPGPERKKIDFPDLKVYIAPPAQGWIDWHKDFVIDGNNDEKHEKNGKLSFLAPDLETELARVDLHNLGIFRLSTESGAGDLSGLIVAELYCEWMAFHLGREAS
jgi:hypothetical protein